MSAIADARYRAERATSGYLDARSQILSAIAAHVAEAPASAAATLDRLTATVRESLASCVADINAATAALAAGDAGAAERQALCDELAYLAGAQSDESADGTIVVTLGGAFLVRAGAVAVAAVDDAGAMTVGGAPVALHAGTARAQSEALRAILPRYTASIRRFVRSTGADEPGYRQLIADVVAEHEDAARRRAVHASVIRTIASLRASGGDDIAAMTGYEADCRACAQSLSAVDEAVGSLDAGLGAGDPAGVRLGQSAALTSADAAVDATAVQIAYELARHTVASVRQTSLVDFLR